MKKSILFLVLLQSLLIFAQAPQRMTYQSVVRNSANVLLANQAVGVRISILEGSLSGTAVYSETHTVTTNANGLFTLEAGGGTPTEGVFADIVWGNGAHYIKSEIDPAGGTNYTLSATKELLSVPYALNGITTAQADAITAQATTITAMQAQISAMQALIDFLLPPPTVSVSGSSYYTYNGSAQGPTEATNSGTGTSYTFSYVGTESTIYAASSTPPTELGTYTVTATVAANGNYSSASSSATAFNIIAPITIGLHPELGGYVISVSMDGKHGIVSETQDQGMCNLNLAGILVQYPASHSAAGQQFTDWRLPTFDELTLMKNEQFKIGGFNMMELYWNCTDYLPLSFNIFGPTLESIGTGNHYVRGVRAF